MYHYYRDKEHLLADIAESYIERLQAIIDQVRRVAAAAAHLRRLIELFMAEYEHSAARHRCWCRTSSICSASIGRACWRRSARSCWGMPMSFKAGAAERSLDLIKPLTMMLFGMINWTFTWFKDRGPLSMPTWRRSSPICFWAALHACDADAWSQDVLRV